MAIYTQLTIEIFRKLPINSDYPLQILNLPSGGNSNSNFILETTKGKYILTIFEEFRPRRNQTAWEDIETFGKTSICSGEYITI